MKYYSIIAFISAVIISLTGIFIYRGKLKGFVNALCKNPKKYKLLGGYFIILSVIMFSRAFATLSESIGAIIYIVFSTLAISIVLSLIRKENI